MHVQACMKAEGCCAAQHDRTMQSAMLAVHAGVDADAKPTVALAPFPTT